MQKKNVKAIYDLAIGLVEIQLQKNLIIGKQKRFSGIPSMDVEFYTEVLNNLYIIKSQNRMLNGFDYYSTFQDFVAFLKNYQEICEELKDSDGVYDQLSAALNIAYSAENEMTLWYRENEDTMEYIPIKENKSEIVIKK